MIREYHSETIDGLCAKIIEQRDRIEALETALAAICKESQPLTKVHSLAAAALNRAALAPEPEK